jgi:hypothetical protein
MDTLTSSAPATYAALAGLLTTACGTQATPVNFFDFEILEYQPGAYIMLTEINGHEFSWEAMNYEFIETYHILGLCRFLTGSVGPQATEAVLSGTYNLFTNIVMKTVVNNRGAPGVPVLGVTSYPSPYEIRPDYAQYKGTPASFGAGQGGFQGVIDFSFQLKALVAPN